MELRIDWRYWWWSRHGFTRRHAPILYETISHPLTDNSTLYLLNRSRIPENISVVEIVPHGGPKSLASPNNIRHNQLWKHMNFSERALQCDRYVVAMIDKCRHDTHASNVHMDMDFQMNMTYELKTRNMCSECHVSAYLDIFNTNGEAMEFPIVSFFYPPNIKTL